MVTNEREYHVTRTWLEHFKQARGSIDKAGADLHPRAQQATRDQHDTQIEELWEQVADYEAQC